MPVDLKGFSDKISSLKTMKSDTNVPGTEPSLTETLEDLIVSIEFCGAGEAQVQNNDLMASQRCAGGPQRALVRAQSRA